MIIVVGLGYVGLPLLEAFRRCGEDVIGFDISSRRVKELKEKDYRVFDLIPEELVESTVLNTWIICVPTPIKADNSPDMWSLIRACNDISPYLRSKDVVVIESTVYPGVTRDICWPALNSQAQGDFRLGYSPERINPGDKEHLLENTVKLVAGLDDDTTWFLGNLYSKVAPVMMVGSIEIAEMSKAIENAQRDINIAFVNEVAVMCHHLNLETSEVLKAAGSKWNFINFKPGLVGGHCIGVDPYYLAQCARLNGYDPRVILAGRRMNESMGPWIARRFLQMETVRSNPDKPKIAVLGMAFKPDIDDMRNSKAVDIVRELHSLGYQAFPMDDNLDPTQFYKEYYLKLVPESDLIHYDHLIIAVGHSRYREFLEKHLSNSVVQCILDVPGITNGMTASYQVNEVVTL